MHAPVDGIQIGHLRTEQPFEMSPEVKAGHGQRQSHVPARPRLACERVKLVLDARDTSPNPGNEQINKFKETLAHTPYFQAQQISTNNIMLKNLSPPQLDSESGKTYVVFSLECLYPEQKP